MDRSKRRARERSTWQLIALRFCKNRLAMAGVIVLGLMILAILLAPLYMPYEEMIRQDVFNKLQPPSAQHPLGTDELGRDLLARVLYGGRISLLGGMATIAIAFTAGCIIGGVAGYFGDKVDIVLMRIIDMLMAIPPVLLAMAILTALGNGLFNLIISLAISQIPRFARVVRSAVLTLRSMEYVDAARCYGCNSLKIILRHILPNGIGPIVVSATLTLGQIILSISSMGFLGLGVASPTPEWGTIISENKLNLRYCPYLGLAPGLCICLVVMAVNFIGDGLRDAFDPKARN